MHQQLARIALGLTIGAVLAMSAWTAVHAQGADATGTIQGSSYTAGAERVPQRAIIVVVPSDTPQPVPIEDYAPDGDPLRTGEAPSTRVGFGLVRPDLQGDYAVTGLEDGEYFVISIAPSLDYAVRPPEQVVMSQRGQTATVPAFRVNIRDGSTETVDIVFAGPPVPSGPASITICLTTFDRKTLDSVQDTIISVEIDPPVEEATITFTEEGCVFIENLPAGTYTFSVETERGFRDSFTEDLAPGADAKANRGIGPVTVGDATDVTAGADATQFPATGSGGAGSWGVLSMILGFAVFGAGAVALAILRRRAA